MKKTLLLFCIVFTACIVTLSNASIHIRPPLKKAISKLPAPTNDECSGALPLTMNTFNSCSQSTAGTINGATASIVDVSACYGDEDDDVWFSFVATQTAHQISLLNVQGSNTLLFHSLWVGNCSNLSLVPNSCYTTNNSTPSGLIIGQTYYIRVFSFYSNSENTTFDICVSKLPIPPVNDECSGALALSINTANNCTLNTAGTIEGATASTVDNSVCNGNEDDDVWFSFVATQTAHKISLLNVQGSTTDLFHSLWTGNCSNLTLVSNSCSDPNTSSISGLTIGQTYYLRVYSYYSNSENSTFSVCVSNLPPPPINDECSGALALTVNSATNCTYKTLGTIDGATASAVNSSFCNGSEDDDVWFSFVATQTAHKISLLNVQGSTTDLFHSLWTGNCSNLTLVTNSCSDPNTSIISGLTIGQTYYLRVYSYFSNNENTTFEVCISVLPPAPANDECSGALALTINTVNNCTYTTAGTIADATPSAVNTNYCNGSEDDDVWFSFIATQMSHQISLINVQGSTTDLYHSLWTGNCSNLTIVANSCSDPNTSIISGLTIGQTYYLRVYSYFSNIENTTFEVCVSSMPPPPINDECSGALALTMNSANDCTHTTAGTIANATASNVNTSVCYGSEDDDVWFSFVATQTTHKISLLNIQGSTTDLYHSLWTGNCSNLTFVLNSCSDPNTSTIRNLTVGQTYYLRVNSYYSSIENTTFEVCVSTLPPPPINDECIGALALTMNNANSCVQTTAGTIAGATASNVNINACYGSEDDDVWFSFVATQSTHQINLLNIHGSTTDLYHSLWTGDCSNLSLVQNSCSDPDNSTPVNLIVGQTYYLRVNSYSDISETTTFEVCVSTLPSPPVNDDCSGALDLTVNSYGNCSSTTPGTIAGATQSAVSLDICNGIADDDVWFKFQATNNTLEISLLNIQGSTTDLNHSLWTYDCSDLHLVSCSDDNVSTANTLVVGQTYFLRVYSNLANSETTTFEVCIRSLDIPPVNDECSAAIRLTVNNDYNCGIVTQGTIRSATASSVPQNPCYGIADDDVWFSFVATQTTHKIKLLNIVGSSFFLNFSLWTGDCTNLTYVPDSCSDANVRIQNGLTIGQTYYIRLYSFLYYPENTTFDICVTTIPPPPVNDECTGALALIVNSTDSCLQTTAGVINSATLSAVSQTDCAGTEDDDVWFSFVATHPIHQIRILNVQGTTTDMVHSLYTGSCGNLILVPNSCSDSDSSQPSGLIVGQTYYIRVFTYQNDVENIVYFDVCVATVPTPPANDQCATNQSLTIGSVFEDHSVVGTTAYATASNPPAPGCASYTGGDVWYSATIPASGNLTIETREYTGSALLNTVVAAYEGNCMDSLVLMGCDDESGIGSFSKLQLLGQTPGNEVYICVWESTGGSNNSGNFLISAFDASLPNTEFRNQNLQFTPNPVIDVFKISSPRSIEVIEVFNTLGQSVEKIFPKSEQVTLNMNSLQSGTYLVKVSVDEIVNYIKILKK